MRVGDRELGEPGRRRERRRRRPRSESASARRICRAATRRATARAPRSSGRGRGSRRRRARGTSGRAARAPARGSRRPARRTRARARARCAPRPARSAEPHRETFRRRAPPRGCGRRSSSASAVTGLPASAASGPWMPSFAQLPGVHGSRCARAEQDAAAAGSSARNARPSGAGGACAALGHAALAGELVQRDLLRHDARACRRRAPRRRSRAAGVRRAPRTRPPRARPAGARARSALPQPGSPTRGRRRTTTRPRRAAGCERRPSASSAANADSPGTLATARGAPPANAVSSSAGPPPQRRTTRTCPSASSRGHVRAARLDDEGRDRRRRSRPGRGPARRVAPRNSGAISTTRKTRIATMLSDHGEPAGAHHDAGRAVRPQARPRCRPPREAASAARTRREGSSRGTDCMLFELRELLRDGACGERQVAVLHDDLLARRCESTKRRNCSDERIERLARRAGSRRRTGSARADTCPRRRPRGRCSTNALARPWREVERLHAGGLVADAAVADAAACPRSRPARPTPSPAAPSRCPCSRRRRARAP